MGWRAGCYADMTGFEHCVASGKLLAKLPVKRSETVAERRFINRTRIALTRFLHDNTDAQIFACTIRHAALWLKVQPIPSRRFVRF